MPNILHLCAKNDTNGNPRRAYVLSNEEGQYVAIWDEGYKGSDAVPGEFRDAAYLSQRFDVTVTEYNKLLRRLPSPDYAYQVEGYSHLR
jgi:hypothetical protein